jgi:hypothetical protein
MKLRHTVFLLSSAVFISLIASKELGLQIVLDNTTFLACLLGSYCVVAFSGSYIMLGPNPIVQDPLK